jgi:uncharacterized ubiquitin-like protein YukD
MDSLITVRARNIMRTKEIDVQIDNSATVGQLLQQAAPQLQINLQGANIMFQGQLLFPEQPLYRPGIGDGDAVTILPGAIVGDAVTILPGAIVGDADPLFSIAIQAATSIVAGIAANYIYNRLHGNDLNELTKRFLIEIFSRDKHLNPKSAQYETASKKVTELLQQELKDWKRINEENGVEVVSKPLPRGKQYEIREKVTELLQQEVKDWKRINEKYGFCTLKNASITKKHIVCDHMR